MSQHHLGRPPERATPFRGSAVRAGLQRRVGLSAIEAVQHPVHARAFSPLGRQGRHRQLPASGLRRQPLRQRKLAASSPFVLRAAQLFAISPEGSENPRVPRLFPGGRRSQRWLLLQSAGRAPRPQAEDDNAAKRLWRESAKLASISERDAGMRRATPCQFARRAHWPVT